MKSLRLLRLALLVSSSLYATETTAFGMFPIAPRDRLPTVELASQRSYYHCHNLPRRIYCHKRGPIPGKWNPSIEPPTHRGVKCFGRIASRGAAIKWR